MIPNDFIQTLLGRVDIVEVVDRHVPLKKAGANYQACCPFHSEKTPSFTVSPTKQFYHCFGCGAHGTAVGFLMEYAGKSFPEAVEDLARDAGLTVPRVERPGEADRREEATDQAALLLTAAKFYRSELRNAPHAIDYLKGRGLTGTVAARFGIGYAPDGWQPLARAFSNYDDAALEQAGLVIRGDAQKRYDRFRDRIMFPIHDSRGRVIGFGGRVLGEGEPKYLNSPETALFSKGRELYGLYLARSAIRDAARVVVVEGYMDVVALAQHGVEYGVATLGTATTPVHVQKLFRLTDSVVFCFDGDAAGRKAAWRALENTLPVLQDGKDARFLFLPEGQDPDDFVRAQGKAAFEAALQAATPLSEYLVSELATRHSPATAEGRAALLAAARPLLATIEAPILAALLRRRLALLAGLPEGEIAGLLDSQPVRPSIPARASPGATRPSARRAPSLARELLQGLLLQPSLVRDLSLPPRIDASPDAQALHAVVEMCQGMPGELTPQGVVQTFIGTPFESAITDALATAEDQALTAELAAERVRAGVARYWQQAERAGAAKAPAGVASNPEETERLRQLEFVRRSAAGAALDSTNGLETR